MEKALVSNGFRYGTSVLEWKNEEFTTLFCTGTCTWVGDPSYKEYEVELPLKGAIVKYRYDGHTRISRTELFGFSQEELSEEIQIMFTVRQVMMMAYETCVINTKGQLIEALSMGENVFTLPDGVHELPYEWGCQSARDVILIKNGKIVDRLTGVGDRAPENWGSESDALKEGKLITTAVKQQEWRQRQWEAFKASYKGTRLYAAARKAGFGDMIPQ